MTTLALAANCFKPVIAMTTAVAAAVRVMNIRYGDPNLARFRRVERQRSVTSVRLVRITPATLTFSAGEFKALRAAALPGRLRDTHFSP